MNFYCSVVDDKLKHETDQPTIGLILCQTKDRILAEYALRDIHKPIGVSDYELTRALPDNLKSSLPSIEEIETELSEAAGEWENHRWTEINADMFVLIFHLIEISFYDLIIP